MIGLMVDLLEFFSHGEYGFSSMGSWGYSREWHATQGQNYVALLLGSEISAGFYYRNSILGI